MSYCQRCGCYIPQRFSACPACHGVDLPQYSRSEQILHTLTGTQRSGLLTEDNAMQKEFINDMQTRYGAEITAMQTRERLMGGGLECIVKATFPNGEQMGLGVAIPPSAEYDTESFRRYVYGEISSQISNTANRIQRLQTDLANKAAYLEELERGRIQSDRSLVLNKEG